MACWVVLECVMNKCQTWLPFYREYTASDGLTLTAGATTYPVQAACAGVLLPERDSTGILVGPDSVCRQYRTSSAICSASTFHLVVPPTRRDVTKSDFEFERCRILHNFTAFDIRRMLKLSSHRMRI